MQRQDGRGNETYFEFSAFNEVNKIFPQFENLYEVHLYLIQRLRFL